MAVHDRGGDVGELSIGSARLLTQHFERRFLADRMAFHQKWEVPGSGHIGGTEAQPQEYERRVTAFFDRELRPQG